MFAALIGCTFASTADAASEHEMAVGGAALYQVCGEKHPEKELSLEQFISLHPHMSTQLANDIREFSSQPKHKAELEQTVVRMRTEATQDLLEVICDSYYRDAKERE
ncbi:hypothetical protein KTQ74_21225 [Pseudomonas chlororaphis]|uniref:hypothetical protein n=1 Tax=Pseudomonas chlororaphis TaxID=587753 RepID=UPI001E4CD42F|nr:hypothetical protein [Pseudomonas chlororaphis]MCB2254441.1 hypothetical protein [Pseudomonas chlororaphis]